MDGNFDVNLLWRLAWFGFTGSLLYFGIVVRRPNQLGWVMFTRASFCEANIFWKEERINLWDYLPHGKVIVDKTTIDHLLQYLRKHKGMYPMSGSVVFYTREGPVRYIVRNAWLV